ncbi:hypothetical protein HMPREF1548_03485 [Clostridium sp. KLE 1755]|nr:hypothetical protein HMPREF1548_03485 [Clostridium sp. KLE 1755]
MGDHLFLYYYPYFCGGKLANELVGSIGAFGFWDLGLGRSLELGFLENPGSFELSFIWRLSHCADCN